MSVRWCLLGCNEAPQTGGWWTTEPYFSQSGVWESELRLPAWLGSFESAALGCRLSPPCCVSHDEQREGESCRGSLFWGHWSCSRGRSSQNLIVSPKPHLPTLSHRGLVFNVWIWGGHKHSVHNKLWFHNKFIQIWKFLLDRKLLTEHLYIPDTFMYTPSL